LRGGGLIHVSPRNHVLDRIQGRTNPFAAVDDNHPSSCTFI